ncbi:MAG TPA: VOC family protein [Kribbella sp.]|uniref:VOC family protein n=1 Tax=Kribbella sp. TaxID=1871183 RepID=UPI002D76F069|nr:VOC family protein [Kribbella sp.]HET6297980.1 VOC family protein [Kribbella sp.]
MTTDVGFLHHVGHVVSDMPDGLDLYRRLGFVLPAPSYPALAAEEGAEPTAFGASNTHAELRRNFLELAAPVRDGSRIPEDAQLVPLRAPAEVLPVLMERIAETSANLAACVDRFEGLHILMLESPAIDSAADRLTRAGVAHGGVNTVQRPVETDGGVKLEEVRYLEISDDGGPQPGTVAEGRVGVAATRQHLLPLDEHPNGAIDLCELVLCAGEESFDAVERRYESYLGRSAAPVAPGHTRFELDAAAITLVTPEVLAELLPGEAPPALPAFVAYAVSVRDLGQTRDYLVAAGVPAAATAAGNLFVSAKAALGAAIIFRQGWAAGW